MKRLNVIVFSLLIILMQVPAPVFAQTVQEPQAECVKDVLTIKKLPKNDRKVAVRIDNSKNGWNLNKPFQGDIAGTITPKDGKYVVNAVPGDTYNWWVHLENKDGTYGKAYGGTLYCGNGSPKDFTYECTDNTITFSWKPVEGAEFYALRINDKENSWNEKKPLQGDLMKNDFKGTSFEIKSKEGKKYDAWIHAVDKEKHYSSANKIAVDCSSQEKKELSFWDQIKEFFATLFK